jgi:hypothetical protein
MNQSISEELEKIVEGFADLDECDYYGGDDRECSYIRAAVKDFFDQQIQKAIEELEKYKLDPAYASAADDAVPSEQRAFGRTLGVQTAQDYLKTLL